ncbi:MAG: 23S rRNA (pseudouridine(1915)-N(3))-methyltransferase RlmH [Bacteroidia bacterium]|nr:23S rRNA (pseudouridine(1915)-N(3))-methyltransferase RlmH [Bacteroidia bacterium]
MTIKLLLIGKTDNSQIRNLTETYINRLKRYIKFDMEVIPDLKNRKSLSEKEQKSREAELILKGLSTYDQVVLLDERGKSLSSVDFAKFLQKKMNSSTKQLVFVVGGPYGFDHELYAKSFERLSLSKMTFSHQMIRPFFVEQLYRAMTILRGEPYHHQ